MLRGGQACVDLSARKAWLVHDGKIVYGPVSIMPGRAGWRTPVGTFHVDVQVRELLQHEFHVADAGLRVLLPGHRVPRRQPVRALARLCSPVADVGVKFFHTLSIGDEVQVVS